MRRRSWLRECMRAQRVLVGIAPLLLTPGAVERVGAAGNSGADVVEISGREVASQENALGGIRVEELDLDPAALATQLVGAAATDAPVRRLVDEVVKAPTIRLQGFDGEVLEFSGEVATWSSIPLFDSNLHVVDWGESISWRSSTNVNADGSMATLTLARTGDEPWRVAGGTIEAKSGEYQLRTDATSGAAQLVEYPFDPGVEDDSITPRDPKLVSSQPGQPIEPESSGVLVRSEPAVGTKLDIMGVTAKGEDLNDGFFYLVAGVNDLNATLLNSSSAGYVTANVTARLIGVVGSTYVQAGVINTDVYRLADAVGALSFVPAARDALGADMVTLVLPDKLASSTCGQGMPPLWDRPPVYTAMTDEFAGTGCSGRKAVSHEIGHNLGAAHNSGQTPIYSDGLAYPASSGPTECSVVHNAYGCRKLIYSNPNQDFPGSSNPSGDGTRFNAHVVSDYLSIAAGYRTPPVQGGGTFSAVAPTRILDTRPTYAIGGYDTPFGAGETRPVSVIGLGNVPAGATAVAINITVSGPVAEGYLTAWQWKTGVGQPATSAVNFGAGQTRASTAIIPVGDYGLINIYASQTTHVIVDVYGYFGGSTSTQKLQTLLPTRAYDSRSPSNPLLAGQTRTISLTGAGVPSGASAAIVNITTTGQTASGFLTANGTGSSIINYVASTAIANMAIIPLYGGAFNVTASTTADTHVVVDVLGYFSTSGSSYYHPSTPVRLVNNFPLGAGGYLDTTVTGGSTGVPTTATAVIGNITAKPASSNTQNTWLKAYPTGSTLPSPQPSTLNIKVGSPPNSNHTIVAPGTSDRVRVDNANDLVYFYFDLEGYFSTTP